MDRPVEPTACLLSLHALTVDQRSTSVNYKQTTDLLGAMERFGFMGDERHKKSPPPVKMEPVTPLFLAQARAKLSANAAHNLKHELKPGDDGYRIETHADLENATGADANTIKHLFGGVRPGTKTKKIGRSKYVAAIRHVLEIPQEIEVSFVVDREKPAQQLAKLTDEQWRRLSPELARLIRETLDETDNSGKR